MRKAEVRRCDSDVEQAAGTRVAETADIALAAFFNVRGLRFLGAVRGKGEDVFFRFEDADDKAPGLAAEYANSAESRYDSAVRTLKKIARSSFGHGVFKRTGG